MQQPLNPTDDVTQTPRRRRPAWWLMLTIGLAVAAGTVGVLRMRQPIVFVGRQQSGHVALDAVNHSDWDQLLTRYVDSNGFVDYSGWQRNDEDHQRLEDYLTQLSAARTADHDSTQAQLAFWINAYNALTIYGILREYPTSSIRNHTPRLSGYNIWNDLKLIVDGQPRSLNEIEHQILRPLQDPRIHFAIVCASKGCPRLLNEAYLTPRVDQQLEHNARDFFQRSQNFRYRDGTLYLSSILDWFGGDFGSDTPSQMERIADWLPSENARTAARTKSTPVRYLDYDWSLNEQQD